MQDTVNALELIEDRVNSAEVDRANSSFTLRERSSVLDWENIWGFPLDVYKKQVNLFSVPKTKHSN